MKIHLLISLLPFALLDSLSAQVLLNDFSAFESANTYFYGGWEASGDPFGTNTPTGTFSQSAGYYSFASTTNADSAFADYFFAAPINLGTLDTLSLTLKLLPDNTAGQITLTLFDDTFNESATTTFSLGSFNTVAFVTANGALSPSGLFNPAAVSAFRISGNDPFGADTFSVEIDHLAAVSAIPEPSTYAAIFGAVALGGVLLRRRFRRAGRMSL